MQTKWNLFNCNYSLLTKSSASNWLGTSLSSFLQVSLSSTLFSCSPWPFPQWKVLLRVREPPPWYPPRWFIFSGPFLPCERQPFLSFRPKCPRIFKFYRNVITNYFKRIFYSAELLKKVNHKLYTLGYSSIGNKFAFTLTKQCQREKTASQCYKKSTSFSGCPFICYWLEY